MRVAFVDFWSDFNTQNNFITHCLRSLYENVEIVHPMNAEYLFFSVFGNENLGYNHCKRISYTGENVSSERLLMYSDYSLTFEPDNGRNRRLPLWYWYIDWFNVSSYGNPNFLIPPKWLKAEGNPMFDRKKDKFCATVFSNPVQSRFEAMDMISSLGQVDGYGKCHRTQVSAGERAKIDLLSQYKFSICFENAKGNGYVTEKLLHARVAGTIPIYWGSNYCEVDMPYAYIRHNGDWDETLHMIASMMDMDMGHFLSKDVLWETSVEKPLNAIKYVTQ